MLAAPLVGVSASWYVLQPSTLSTAVTLASQLAPPVAEEPPPPLPPPGARLNVTPASAQSSPDAERPCAPIVTVPDVPAGMVICARTALSEGPSLGTIQNTAPLSADSALSAVHESQSIPMEEIAAPALPSLGPTLSHESTAAVAERATKAGLTPPTLAPNGAPSWYAAGAVSVVVASPKIV